mmetsp:Transcript_76519/g.127470  ORF Transcript_76519/g.127470 Transcript_76519/m.127470 type:complete len:221 (-) Transcript_76519:176-838(-)
MPKCPIHVLPLSGMTLATAGSLQGAPQAASWRAPPRLSIFFCTLLKQTAGTGLMGASPLAHAGALAKAPAHSNASTLHHHKCPLSQTVACPFSCRRPVACGHSSSAACRHAPIRLRMGQPQQCPPQETSRGRVLPIEKYAPPVMHPVSLSRHGVVPWRPTPRVDNWTTASATGFAVVSASTPVLPVRTAQQAPLHGSSGDDSNRSSSGRYSSNNRRLRYV